MNFQDHLVPWMGRTMKLMDYYFTEVFKFHKIDLTKHQWIVLKVLSESDGLPQNELAFVTNRDKTSLTRLISTLEKKNLVARIPSKSDKRVNQIYLTKHGRETFNDTLPIIETILTEIQAPLTKDEMETAIKIIQKIHENLTTKITVA